MNRRIAFYLPDLKQGGAETVFVTLAEGLARQGYRTGFVLDRGEGALLTRTGRPVEILHASRTLAAVGRLALWLRRNRPDVLFSAIAPNNIAALAARLLAQVPTAVIVGEHSIFSRQTGKSWQFRLAPCLARLLYPQAAAIVTVSEASRRDLDAILRGSCPVTVLPNPAIGEEAASRAGAPPPHPWLAEEAGPPVILAAGRLEKVKDFGTLLTAFARVTARRPARLIILGEGPERPGLEALRDRLGLEGSVVLPGSVPDTLPWFARAAAVVLSSRYEGFGLVLVEAMACGTPVATTEAGGPPAEILKGGLLGPVAPSGDADALAAAILSLLERPVDREALRRRAADFSVSASLAAYSGLIERVCAGNAS